MWTSSTAGKKSSTIMKIKLFTAVLLGSLVLFNGSLNAAVVLNLQSANYNAATGVWTDVSGNSNNANSFGSNIPSLLAGATPNGTAALDFSAGGKVLTLSTPLTSASFTTSPNLTIFFVGRSASTSSSYQPILYGASYQSLGYRLDQAVSGNTTITETLTSINQLDAGTAGAATIADYHVFAVSYIAATRSFSAYVDGVYSTGWTENTSFATTDINYIGGMIGMGNYFQGQMAALIVDDTALSDANILLESANLKSTYIIPEPSSVAMLGLGIMGLLILVRSRGGASANNALLS